jgi:uncharacterized protein (TIGR03437 family)
VKLIYAVLLAAAFSSAWPADNPARPALTFSKTFGGSASDTGVAVATDPLGNIYYAGATTSTDFPIVNGFQKRIQATPFRATTDGGKTWTTPGIPDTVYAVAGTPKQPAVVYAGTASAIYKSLDSGKTWTVLPSAGIALVGAIWIDPDTPSIVHAATDKGMIRSDDAGATWKAPPSGKGNVLAMAASPARPATLFAAMDIGAFPQTSSLYRSVDGGSTWTVLANSPFGPFALACDPAVAGVVYLAASTSGFSYSGTTATYKSTDSGNTWTRISDASLVISTWTLVATADTVFLGTRDGLLRSADGGKSWQATSITVSADALAVDPTQPRNIYANTDLGVFASTDGGIAWKSILPVRQFVYSLTVAPTTPPTVYVGAGPGRNIFVAKWSPDGARLLYSTYLGGSYFDYVTGLAVDRQGNAYVTGYAYSNDFPVTANAAQSKHAGGYDGFVAKIGPNGDSLLYSTYLGGEATDLPFGIALDASANVYVTGYTSSTAFPVSTGAVQAKLREFTRCLVVTITGGPVPARVFAANAFVTKLDTQTGAIRYSTYLGGGCTDEGIGIAVDSAGSAYIAGATFSPDFPVTPGALQAKTLDYSSSTIGFLAKLSPQGDALTYSTFLGGTYGASAFAVAVDAKGAAYVTGATAGFDGSQYAPNPFISTGLPPGYPPVAGAFQGGAAFVAKVDPAASSLGYLRYLGGTWGAGTGIALDASGNAWIAGATSPTITTEPFPTVHPFQAKTGSGFVARVAADGSLTFSSLLGAARQIALDPSGNALISGTVGTKAALVRVDAAVPSAMTIEEPLRFTPTLRGVLDRGISPGQIITIPGAGLGPHLPAVAQFDSGGALPTALAGASVLFGDLAAPLLSVQSDQIVCVVPFSLPPGSITTLQARNAGNASNAIVMPVATSAIQILAAVNADGTPNSREHPAPPGSVIALYGTGFGQTSPPGHDGTINGGSAATFAGGPIFVTVADQNAQVLYAGPAPGQVAGVVQVNFRLPALVAGSYPAVVGWSALGFGDRNDAQVWIGQP